MRGLLMPLVAAIGVLAVAAPALAHDHGWKHKRHHRHHHHHHHHHERSRALIVERPVVVVPARPVYYEAPMYYGPPPGMSLNFNFPLR
jgi:hypothetical protein